MKMGISITSWYLHPVNGVSLLSSGNLFEAKELKNGQKCHYYSACIYIHNLFYGELEKENGVLQ